VRRILSTPLRAGSLGPPSQLKSLRVAPKHSGWDIRYAQPDSIVVNPDTDFSPLGQIVILVLIQPGGLGIMTFAAFRLKVLGRWLSFRHPLRRVLTVLGKFIHCRFRCERFACPVGGAGDEVRGYRDRDEQENADQQAACDHAGFLEV